MKCALTLAFLLAACGSPSASTLSSTAAVSDWSLRWFNAAQPSTTYRSTDHAGAVFVVENYFDSCGACNENAPNVDALQTAYQGNGRVQILDVGIDRSDRQYQNWVSKHHPNHPVLMDPDRKLTGELGTTAYPSTYVLDCNKNVRYRSLGVWDSATKQAIRSAIENALTDTICAL